MFLDKIIGNYTIRFEYEEDDGNKISIHSDHWLNRIKDCLSIGIMSNHISNNVTWKVVNNHKIYPSTFKEISLIPESIVNTDGIELTNDIIHSLSDYLDDFLTFHYTSEDVLYDVCLITHNIKMKGLKSRKLESKKILLDEVLKSNPQLSFRSWIQPILSFLLECPKNLEYNIARLKRNIKQRNELFKADFY
jgi:hypothetical protein